MPDADAYFVRPILCTGMLEDCEFYGCHSECLRIEKRETNTFCSPERSKVTGMAIIGSRCKDPITSPKTALRPFKQTGGGLSVSYNPFMFIEFSVFTLFIDGAKDVGF